MSLCTRQHTGSSRHSQRGGRLARRVDYALFSIVDSPPAHRDSVYHGQRAPNPQETSMRRFDLVLPNSLEDCLKILAERGAQAKLVAGGTDLLPQMKNGALHPAVVVDLSGIARAPAGPERQRPAHRRRGHRARARAEPGAGRAVSRRSRRARPWSARCRCATWRRWAATSATPRPRPTWRRRWWRWRPSRSSRARGGERRVPMADFFTGVRKTVLAPNELLVELDRAGRRARTAAASTCGTRRGASSTSRWSAWRRSSRWPAAAAPRRASRWPRWRPRRSARPRPSRRSRARR